MDIVDHADQRALLDRTSLLMQCLLRVKKKKERKVRKKLCSLDYLNVAFDGFALTPPPPPFRSPADTTSSAAARIANLQQYLLAMFKLIQQALCQFGLFEVQRRREVRAGHHLAQRPARGHVVLVDVCDSDALHREYDLRVVVKFGLPAHAFSCCTTVGERAAHAAGRRHGST